MYSSFFARRVTLLAMCGFHFILANAAPAESSNTNLIIIFGGLIAVAITAVLAFLLVRTAKVRRHRRTDVIRALAIVWAVLTAGSLLYAGQSQMDWKKEYTTRIESGDFDPNDTTDAPRLPWVVWGVLGVGYMGMLGWSMRGTVK